MMAKRRDTAGPSIDEQALTEKLTRIGYPDFTTKAGEEDVLMLYIEGHLIGGVEYALSLSDDALKALIDETFRVVGGQE